MAARTFHPPVLRSGAAWAAWLALTAALAALRQCTHRVRVLLATPGSSR